MTEYDLGHWQCDIEIPSEFYGFIYTIKNNENNKSYIGKKQCKFKQKKALRKGKKNRKTVLKESDWKSYTSSCKELNEDIVKFGKDKFEFNIVRFCNSKWALSYFEAKMQFDNNVLLDYMSYNGIINCRIGKVPKSNIDLLKS